MVFYFFLADNVSLLEFGFPFLLLEGVCQKRGRFVSKTWKVCVYAFRRVPCLRARLSVCSSILRRWQKLESFAAFFFFFSSIMLCH